MKHSRVIDRLVLGRSPFRRAISGLLAAVCMALVVSCAPPSNSRGQGAPSVAVSRPVTTEEATLAVEVSPSATVVAASPTPLAPSTPTPGEFQSPLLSPLIALPEVTPSAEVPPSATVAAASPAPPASPTPTPGQFQSPLLSPPATSPEAALASREIPVYTYRIISVYPHDPAAFTQGLVYEYGVLYEGTGLRGRASLRRVALESGEVLQFRALPARYFGEGITIWDDRIIQLTWRAGQGFVYDKESFELLDTFQYPTEGWGITHDGTKLIMSDGTATLHFWDPETFEEIGQVEVRDDEGPVMRLNELEYVQGRVYANIWQTDRVAIIDPQTGRVSGWINLAGLLTPEDRTLPVDVLNGIACYARGNRLWVTGKLWPKLFEIELVPAQ